MVGSERGERLAAVLALHRWSGGPCLLSFEFGAVPRSAAFSAIRGPPFMRFSAVNAFSHGQDSVLISVRVLSVTAWRRASGDDPDLDHLIADWLTSTVGVS